MLKELLCAWLSLSGQVHETCVDLTKKGISKPPKEQSTKTRDISNSGTASCVYSK